MYLEYLTIRTEVWLLDEMTGSILKWQRMFDQNVLITRGILSFHSRLQNGGGAEDIRHPPSPSYGFYVLVQWTLYGWERFFPRFWQKFSFILGENFLCFKFFYFDSHLTSPTVSHHLYLNRSETVYLRNENYPLNKEPSMTGSSIGDPWTSTFSTILFWQNLFLLISTFGWGPKHFVSLNDRPSDFCDKTTVHVVDVGTRDVPHKKI